MSSAALRSRKPLAAAVAALMVTTAAFVAPWEGFAARPYKDIVGKVTWCYGETQGAPQPLYTQAECQALLVGRLPDYYEPIKACWGEASDRLLGDNQRVAFLSSAYNFGVGAFCKSSMVRLLREGNVRAACEALMLYTRAGGKVIKGLVNRRSAERALCLKGL